MQAKVARFPAMGFDTILKITEPMARALKAAKMDFAVRYLGSLTEAEMQTLTSAGIAVMAVTYSRAEGWVPSGELGTADGQKAVGQLKLIRYPVGATVWLDLEGCRGPAAATAAWVNNWASQVQAAGFVAGLYVGAAPGGLDSAGLYSLKVTRYWRSCSRVPDVAVCSYCAYQLYPPNVKVAGVQVDVDVLCQDFKGRLPVWVEA